MVKKIEKIINTINGEFLGIVPPKFEFFKINLLQRTQVIKPIKKNSEEFNINDYTIEINSSEISNSYYEELSKNLKQLFDMSWVQFNWDTKIFLYYTTKYTGEDGFKKQQLTNIFEFLIDFEKKYKEEKAISYSDFNVDKKEFKSYKDEDIVVKYNADLDAFIVLAISFLGSEKYRILANASKQKDKFGNSLIDKNFFDDIYQNKNIDKKMFFIINTYDYAKVKGLIEKNKEEKEIFLNTQEKVVEEYRTDFVSYEEKNIFKFKLKFIEDKKCFEFYSKGFSDPQSDRFGHSVQRSLLARWALNFIFSEEVPGSVMLKDGKMTHVICYEVDTPNFYKVELDIQKGSSLRDKELFIPADNWDRLNRIYNRFLEVNKLFNRPEKTVKIKGVDFLSRASTNVNLTIYPAIYLSEKGDPLFIYQYRSLGGKITFEEDGKTIKKCTENSVSMKGVPITFQEMNEFFTSHLYAEKIKANSIFLNSEIWLGINNKSVLLNEEERKIAFDSIYMHAKLANDIKNDSSVVIKKHKI
jgi:hypothetical protein